MASQAWYTYPRIDNFGQIDPQGAYYKPDSNVLTPPGAAITALLPGTVTSVQRTSWGQTVVTIKLDQPLNSLATHMFYEHMHDATVSIGQHVVAGQLVGNANYAGEGANLGVGLYSGDIYGSGSSWSILQNDLKPGGQGLLNPVKLLNTASTGGLGNLGSLIGGNTALSLGGIDLSGLTNAMNALQPWLSNPIRIVKILVGAILIGAALFMLIAPEAEKVATKAAELGVLA